MTCFLLRIATDRAYAAETYDWFKFCGTHLRIDSLFFGVLLAYLCHVHNLHSRLTAVPSWILGGAGLACLSPAFTLDIAKHHWAWAGLVVSLYVGAGFLVIAAIRLSTSHNLLIRGLASLGAASYSIYLWHMAINIYCTQPIERVLGVTDSRLYLVLYIGGSLAFGWIMSRLIELPVLRLRDRLFSL